MENLAGLASALHRLWFQHRDLTYSRLEQLRSALSAMESGDLAPHQQSEALDAAHKLAGTLGTFGLDRATEAARKLQAILSSPATLNPSDVAEFRSQLQVLAADIESYR
ncbi:MAG: Hpt domain-containing protein [Acidobacteriales bacterium]|nr:Hpt domain-containing protein [Terriglobales bacterium]